MKFFYEQTKYKHNQTKGKLMRFSLIKREPSFFFENMHEDLQRFLKDTFGDIEPSGSNVPFERTFRPAVEVKETNEEYKIDVELTGVKKEDISLSMTPEHVMVSAESKFEKCEGSGDVKYSEFRYGKFTRTIPFDKPVNLEDASSEFKDGILHITVKKAEPKREDVKKIEIK